MQTGKTRWTHYQIAYHFVWIPKYRRKIFTGEGEALWAAWPMACKKLIEECCIQQGFVLLALETDVDHVHCFVSAKPRWAPTTIVGLLKGYTSRKLREQFPKLKKVCGHEQLWTQAYYVGTAGSVSAEVIRRYIQECQGQ
ncbi:MAG: IS200/IS605 family transposase [Acidiferrobacter sp.]